MRKHKYWLNFFLWVYIKTIYLAASLATCDDILPADIFQKLFGPRSKCLTPLDILGKNYFENNQQATKRHSALPSMQKKMYILVIVVNENNEKYRLL